MRGGGICPECLQRREVKERAAGGKGEGNLGDPLQDSLAFRHFGLLPSHVTRPGILQVVALAYDVFYGEGIQREVYVLIVRQFQPHMSGGYLVY